MKEVKMKQAYIVFAHNGGDALEQFSVPLTLERAVVFAKNMDRTCYIMEQHAQFYKEP